MIEELSTDDLATIEGGCITAAARSHLAPYAIAADLVAVKVPLGDCLPDFDALPFIRTIPTRRCGTQG
jgi:bacteriocin-like protein